MPSSHISLMIPNFLIEPWMDKPQSINNSSEQVLNEITSKMSRGLTVLEGRGGYTGANKNVLYIVINKQEIIHLKKIIKEVDENAYVTAHNVHEMIGRGYKEVKTS